MGRYHARVSESARATVIHRVLSPAQAETRARLIDAAIELASLDGYEAVSMREVARLAGMSTAKAYQHAGTKDQLLFEALMTLGERSTASVRARRPTGETPAERIEEVFSSILAQVALRPQLYRAMYRAYMASSPAIGEIEGLVAFGPERAGWIGEALRAGASAGYLEEDFDEISRVLSTIFLGAMVSLAAGRRVESVVEVLQTAARRLLSPPAR